MSLIIECPTCATRYRTNKAVPEGGRWVKCARCAQTWHLLPEDSAPASWLATSQLHTPILMGKAVEEAQVHDDRLVAPSQSSREQHEIVAETTAREKNMHDDEKRVALVVGNGKYQKTSWLANPPNDAEKMGAALGRLGFEVLHGTNLDYGNFAKQVRDFGRALREAHVALFFYAGHGLQVRGENYVVPVDAALEHEADVQLELIAVQTILASMEIGNRTSIVILDACRDNPLARNLARAIRSTRPADDIGRGLGRLESSIGTYIAFATSPNRIALDGQGAANSPFTTALLKHIEAPGLAITDIMMQVRRDVIAATEKTREGPQVPWDNSSLVAPFYFLRPRSGMTQDAPPPNPAIVIDPAERDWERWRIAETEELAIIEAYIAKYAASEPIWSVRARQRLEVVQALIAEREEQSRRDEQQQAEFAAKDFVKIEAWTPKGKERRWIAPGSGEAFRDFERGPEMVIVPRGEFQMGSLEGEEGRSKHKGPQHHVTIPAPFALGRYPVTFAEWDAFVAAKDDIYKPDDASWGRGDRPVINVSWHDVQPYLDWLRQVSGFVYRLPSEAEWEYAARAGTRTRYCFGDDDHGLGDHAWHRTNSGGKTHDVGERRPNGWGLCDMYGNVWEWCEDQWHDSYADKPEGLKASGGAWTTRDGGARVLRGGSWSNLPQDLRSAFRVRHSPAFRSYISGFRVARTLSPL